MEEEKKKLRVALFGHEPIRYIIHDNDLWYLWEDECKILGINNKVLGKIYHDELRPFNLEDGSSALFISQWSTSTICYKRRRPVFREWFDWCLDAMMQYRDQKLSERKHEQREAYYKSKVTDVIKEHFKGVENVSYEWLYVFQSNMFTLFDAFDELLHEHGIDMSLAEVIKAKRESLKNK